jgi:peptidoglycan/LPS O-acetylase OafA/YrhL
MTTQQSVSSKVTYLDGLRGVAAFVVLLAHFKELFLPQTAIDGTPVMFVLASKLAVIVFFVHSGFVLAWKYVRTGDVRVLVSMGLRRPLRLGIPIAAAVVFSWALMRAGLMANAQVAPLTGSGGAFSQLYGFEPTFSSAAVDALGGVLFLSNYRYNGAFWTMPIELLCSYVVFVVLPFAARTATSTLVLLVLAGFLATINSYPWFTCFMAGILLARFHQEQAFREDGVVCRLPTHTDSLLRCFGASL